MFEQTDRLLTGYEGLERSLGLPAPYLQSLVRAWCPYSFSVVVCCELRDGPVGGRTGLWMGSTGVQCWLGVREGLLVGAECLGVIGLSWKHICLPRCASSFSHFALCCHFPHIHSSGVDRMCQGPRVRPRLGRQAMRENSGSRTRIGASCRMTWCCRPVYSPQKPGYEKCSVCLSLCSLARCTINTLINMPDPVPRRFLPVQMNTYRAMVLPTILPFESL